MLKYHILSRRRFDRKEFEMIPSHVRYDERVTKDRFRKTDVLEAWIG
jgi:hypothetical protein